METWSAGKAVLHGMGLEITSDFLVFDLLDVLHEKGKDLFSTCTRHLSNLKINRLHFSIRSRNCSHLLRPFMMKAFPEC